MVRRAGRDNGPGPQRREIGDPFVECEWDTPLDLLSGELARVRDGFGAQAIFGGSYGWASAGRFHHAQSQVTRFLNTTGGYVRHVDSYSSGASRALMLYIAHPMDEIMAEPTDWHTLHAHCDIFVPLGGVPPTTPQTPVGGTAHHQLRQ